MEEEKTLHKIYFVGDHQFTVYREYDEQWGESYPVYPDFEECPEYTREGRPYATSIQDACPHAKGKENKEPPSDCGGCDWFFRQNTYYDPIGICMNENNVNNKKPKKKEETK